MRRKSLYLYDRPDWPDFSWDLGKVAARLSAVRHQQGRLIGHMEALGFPLQQEAILRTLTEDVVKSSEIEGEVLDVEQVRSSVARRLGMEVGGLVSADRDVEGVVEMMLDATRQYDQPLERERLFAWHASLFPSGRSGMRKIRAGAWREEGSDPMQVVSGPIGHERVHFEAPAGSTLEREMHAFLVWLNDAGPGEPKDAALDLVVKAGLAHLWFVTVHPFDDGNGRIARAIADLVLARSEGSPRRYYSMSAQIRRERKAYYEILEQTQKGGLDVTPWLDWFLACLGRAIDGAQTTLALVLTKARFWQKIQNLEINSRQRLLLNRLLDGFEGALTTSKWAKIAKCSSDTALRDILDLVERGVLVRNPEGGRSSSYALGPP